MLEQPKTSIAQQRFSSVAEFYPFYLSQHQVPLNRRLHFVGTSSLPGLLLAAIVSANWWWLLFMPLAGYGFAWVGHFVFERNKPATFKYPIYSLVCDFRMYIDMLRGRIKW